VSTKNNGDLVKKCKVLRIYYIREIVGGCVDMREAIFE